MNTLLARKYVFLLPLVVFLAANLYGVSAKQEVSVQHTATPAPAVVIVELYEWGIDSSIQDLPTGRVMFHVTNVGTRAHSFHLEGPSANLRFPGELQVGQTRTLLADLQPGAYQFTDPLEDYQDRGMRLELTVAEGQPADATPIPQTGPQGQMTQTPQPGLDQQDQVTPSPQPGDQQGQQDQTTTQTPQPGQDEGQGEGSGQEAGGEELIQQGEQVYGSSCATCHGPNGEGQVGPALAGNQFVTSEDPAPVIDTVLHGRGQMPPFQDELETEQIAAVISFIRNTWGNSASPVTPDQVGGDQADGDETAGGPQVTMELSASAYQFDQEQISVPAGSSVTIEFTNQQDIPHNFALYENAAASRALFIGQVFTGPNRTVTYQFTAPAQPGTYFFRCDVHPYMNGEFVVE